MGTGVDVINNFSCEEFNENLKLLPSNDQVKEIQTILRDR